MSWLTNPAHAGWLEADGDRLLDFGRAAVHPEGGFAWLSDDGTPELGRPVELWITCRMVHVYSLGHLMGRPDCGRPADHGVAALRERFHDHLHGGWYAKVGADGPPSRTRRPTSTRSSCWRGERRGRWTSGRCGAAEQGARNTVRPLLGRRARHGAGGVGRVLHDLARGNQWRIPEHFDDTWAPLPEYNVDEPAHPFRPYGATIGHWLGWARLALHLRAAIGSSAPEWLLEDARSLFAASVREGWAVDGRDGFAYTVDWSGAPVVRERMHWVAAEATATAATLFAATGDPEYAAWYTTWWQHVADCFVDRERGSWRHELAPTNGPSNVTWNGKPDTYHAL